MKLGAAADTIIPALLETDYEGQKAHLPARLGKGSNKLRRDIQTCLKNRLLFISYYDRPFAKRTMDSRLRKNRDKRMKNKKKKKVPTGPAPYEDVTSMFMVKR